MGLIAEFKIWLSQNQDKGYAAFLSASQKGPFSEDTPWDIRKMISQAAGKASPDPQEDQLIRWHLILHLAREFEVNQEEAKVLLNRLRHQKSPLEGALEEPPSKGFFEDTPLMETPFQVDADHHRQVIEAWFGLFGSSFEEDETLITLDPQVLEYA